MDVNTVDSQGHTALYLGAIHGCTEIIRILLQNGAIKEIADNIGRTHFLLLLKKDRWKVIKALAKKDAELRLLTKLCVHVEEGENTVNCCVV